MGVRAGVLRSSRHTRLGAVSALVCALVLLAASATAHAEAPQLVSIGTFAGPTYVTAPTGDPHRLFVVERGGTVRVLRDGVRLASPFLDVSSLTSTDGERGLLSMAFAPDYATSGRFYVYFVSGDDGHIEVDEFRRSSTDADRADPGSRRIVFTQAHPAYSNHNGGQLQFGPDGFLYLGLGDGGGGGDPNHHAQDLSTPLGKMLRIDPLNVPARASDGHRYSVPATNPFVGTTGARPEIYQSGLRNPYRFSFDRATGDLYLSDVGQSAWEEVDFASRGGAAGINWGWNPCEGTHAYPATTPPSPCTLSGSTRPVAEYDHSGGRCSITGGYVARDPSLGDLTGSYVYGDFCSGQLYALRMSGGVAHDQRALTGLDVAQLVSFGEDSCGHLYATSLGTNSVYRFQTSTTVPCGGFSAPTGAGSAGPPQVRIDRRTLDVRPPGYLRVRLRCPGTASGSCRGPIALRYHGLLVPRGTFSAAPGRLAAPRLRLSARGRLLLRRRGELRVRVDAVSSDVTGRSARTRTTLLLRRAG